MHKFNRNDSIVERHFGVGRVVLPLLFHMYLVKFENKERCPTPKIWPINERNMHKYNKTTGERT